MGHVTVSVNQHRKLVGCFAVSHSASSSLPHMFLIYVNSRRAAVLKAKEKLAFIVVCLILYS